MIASSRVFVSSVYESLAGILSQQQHMTRLIDAEVKADLETWLHFLQDTIPERSFQILTGDSGCPPIYTDVSTSVGYGGVCGDTWFWGTWPSDERPNIAALELYPIYVVLHMLEIKCTVVQVVTDNEAIVAVVNKLYVQ